MVIITTAAVAIGRRIADSRAEKNERLQGLLKVKESNAAMGAYAMQRTCARASGPGSGASTNRSGNEIAHDEPGSLEVPRPILRPTVPADRAASSIDLTSASQSMARSTPPLYFARSTDNQGAKTSSLSSHESDSATMPSLDRPSLVSADATSDMTKGIRIRTKGSDLKSGFAYHPALFELQVHPTMWDAFTTQLIETTKFTLGDHAQVWAAAAGVACTGALVTSVLVGRGMGTRVQEKKVKSGLLDTSDDGLKATLQRWNDGYFRERGLKASLELSESATKNGRNQSKLIQKGLYWYPERQDRERKREQRKFVIVVTRLHPEASGDELVEMPGDNREAVVELSAAGDSSVMELPTNGHAAPAELPGDLIVPTGVSLGFDAPKWTPRIGIAELESPSTHSLKPKLNCEKGIGVAELEGDLHPAGVGDGHR
ncbi:hypothetical protein Tdes44962_MAKER01865 [Teratosphaeria destructans]|uniref:Uncharacterized protein n=1 Tax=Teratosphaeria destructans TaxID=418781 RepID=A0A9W7W4U2_9PEZI|nr:hypothetical protein Tdes44962_MAKER01865 [Teratosphaeria destructans]